jgi:hypothetical protein
MKRLFPRKLNIPRLALACALGALLLPAAMFAQAPGKHPAYLHALSDLRMARAYLSAPNPNGMVDNNASQAIQQIDAAIGELKKASIDDGKNPNSHMPVDAHLDRTNRFHKAQELLDQAHADVAREEDDPAAVGLQGRIIKHIDAAHGFVANAISVTG